MLEEENTMLRIKAEQMKKNENNIRTEFAKAFGWIKFRTYGKSDEWRTPSWEEIFTQVGKLLADKHELRTDDRLKELEDGYIGLQSNNEEK